MENTQCGYTQCQRDVAWTWAAVEGASGRPLPEHPSPASLVCGRRGPRRLGLRCVELPGGRARRCLCPGPSRAGPGFPLWSWWEGGSGAERRRGARSNLKLSPSARTLLFFISRLPDLSNDSFSGCPPRKAFHAISFYSS